MAEVMINVSPNFRGKLSLEEVINLLPETAQQQEFLRNFDSYDTSRQEKVLKELTEWIYGLTEALLEFKIWQFEIDVAHDKRKLAGLGEDAIVAVFRDYKDYLAGLKTSNEMFGEWIEWSKKSAGQRREEQLHAITDGISKSIQGKLRK